MKKTQFVQQVMVGVIACLLAWFIGVFALVATVSFIGILFTP